MHKLPDLLRPGLALVFVGTAAGRRSAESGFYYAGPGNGFWRAIHNTGITLRLYEPHEYEQLLMLGIGFTDLSKLGSGMDHQIKRDQYDVPLFEANIRKFQPRAVAFTSKTAASKWRGISSTRRIMFGRQKTLRDGFPEVFVLPSPSGAARATWDIAPWQELGAWLADNRPTFREHQRTGQHEPSGLRSSNGKKTS